MPATVEVTATWDDRDEYEAAKAAIAAADRSEDGNDIRWNDALMRATNRAVRDTRRRVPDV